MSIRWRKVLGDARAYRAQIGLIALVLALGTAGVVAALDARAILGRAIAASYAAARAPDIVLWFDRVDAPLMALVDAQAGVAAVEAQRVAITRIAAQDGTWLPMRLTIVGDLDARRVGAIHRHAPAAPAGAAGIWIEQSGRSLLGTGVGGALRIRTPTGGIAAAPLAGFVHDTAVAPSTQDRVIYAFATPAGAALLGQEAAFDQLLVRMRSRGDASDALALAGELDERLKAQGRAPLRVDTLAGRHPHAALMDAMLRVLGVLCAVAFTCTTALAGYMVAAWMRREVRIVGVMKAMGARAHQVALQYLALAAPLALLVAAVALPVGAALGRAVVRHYATVMNIDVARWDVAPRLMLEEAALTLGIALASMAWPIVRACRVGARAAMHDAGIVAPSGPGTRLARAMALPGGLRWTFALRNALRRPWRLAFMLLALSSGGALLLTTHSNYESMMGVIDASLARQGHDIEVLLARPAPGARLQAVALGVPGVRAAEAWRRATASPVAAASDPATASDARRVALLGYPPQTHLFRLPVVEGRMPRAGASDEILMTRTVRDAFPGLGVGSEVRLPFRGRVATVRVAGVVEEIGNPTLYMGFPAFEAVTGIADASTDLRVKVDGDHPESVAGALDQALLDAGLAPAQLLSGAMLRAALDEHFKVVGDVLRMVALAAALVGAIVLAAASGFNVLERTREIAVMRALGAAPRDIVAMLTLEGAAVAVAGALLAVALSIALTLALNEAAARTLLRVAVPLRLSMAGFALLCAGVLVVICAAWLAVDGMLRRTVGESLGYE